MLEPTPSPLVADCVQSLPYTHLVRGWYARKPDAHPEPTISLRASILDGRFVMHPLARNL
jgi:hypothetical protein